MSLMGYNWAKEAMENKNKNNETQNRREFFKEAAKKSLPLFAIALIGPSVLSSCTKENLGCGGCGNTCSGSCKGDCAGDCDDNCTADCWNGCNRWQK